MGRKRLQAEDYINKQFERLTVKDIVFKQSGKQKLTYFICECSCGRGNVKEIDANHVKSGHTKSCGCLNAETREIHGQVNTRLYVVWQGMKRRCYNPKDKSYQNYGGRGIRVCDEWHEFLRFSEWAYANNYDETAEYKACTIERKENNGNYEPDNCCFADAITQSRNRRIPITNTSGIKGVSYHRKTGKWQARIGINGKRINLGYHNTKEQAIEAREKGEKTYRS